MSTLITCMGECLIDFLPLKANGEHVDFRMYAAGSILNVAVGLARLEKATAFACKVADDYFGRYLQTYMAAEKIDSRFLVPLKGGRSTLAFVAMENGIPTFSFYGEGAADTLLTVDELPDTLFTETRILHFGSISLLQGTTPDAVLKTVEQLKGKALLSFDPNIRPELVRDEERYRALLQQMIGLADVVKLSDADLAWMRPGLSSEEALQELVAQGPGLVVITRGAQGVMAATTGGASAQMPTFAVEVADTVGAGDAFCSGLLAQLAERDMTAHASLAQITTDELGEILCFAAAVAALNCTQPGANPPRRAVVEQFLRTTCPRLSSE